MADMYFKVRADYEELVKMQQQATRLKNELSDFSGTRSEFIKLQRQFQDLGDKIVDVSTRAAQDFQKSFENLGDVSPNFFKNFDKEFSAFSEKMVRGISELEKEYSQMGRDILSSIGSVKGAPEVVDAIRARLKTLYTEVQAGRETVNLQKDVWKGVFDQADSGISALLPKLKGLIPDELFAKLEKIPTMVSEANKKQEQTFGKVSELVLGTAKSVDDMTLALERAGQNTSLDTIIEKSKALYEEFTRLKQQSKDAGGIGEQAYVDFNIGNTGNVMQEKLQSALSSARADLDKMQINTPEYEKQLSLIQQIREQLTQWGSAVKEVDAATQEQAKKDSQAKIEQIKALQELLAKEEERAEKIRQQAAQAAAERDASKPNAIQRATVPISQEVYERNSAAAQEWSRRAEEAGSKADFLRANIEKLTQALTEEEKAQLAATQASSKVQTATKLQEEIAAEERKLEILKQQNETKKSLGEKIATAIAPNVMEAGETAKQNEAIAEQEAKVRQLKTAYEEFYRSQDEGIQKQINEVQATRQASQQRAEYVEQLKRTGTAATSVNETIASVVEKGSAAFRAIDISQLRNALQSTQEDLKKTEEELQKAHDNYQKANAELTNLQQRMVMGDQSVSVGQVEEAKQKVESMKAALTETAGQYNEINGQVQQYKQQLDEASGHQVRMRTQIMNAREELIRMIAAGQQGTPAFQQAAIEAGKLRKQMTLANAAMSYFANPTRHLAALKTGLQGVAGAAGLVNGAMGLFNSESKKMQEIQTKVQSVMAIVVGLETTYNAIKKTSTLMLAIEEVKTLAVAAAKRVQAIGTAEATVAQEALNAAMAANPLGAVLVVVTTLAAAIWGLCSAMSGASDAAKKAAEDNKAWNDSLTQSYQNAAKTIVDHLTKYKNLRKSYEETKAKGESLDKWVKTHQKGMKDVGLSVKNTTDAENIFARNTDTVTKAIIARAQAAAYAALEMRLLEEETALILARETGDYSHFEGAVKVGDKVDRNRAAARGLDVSNWGSGSYEIASEADAEKWNRAELTYRIGKLDGQRKLAQEMKKLKDIEVKHHDKDLKKNGGGVKGREEVEQESQTNKEPKQRTKKNKKTKQTKEKHHQNDEWQEEETKLANKIKDAEEQLKFEREYQNRLTEESIKLMDDGYAKRKRQEDLNHKKTIEAIEQRYRERTLKTIAAEKAEFDKEQEAELKKNPKYKKAHYYESDKYKAHFDEKGELKLTDEDKAYMDAEKVLQEQTHQKNMLTMQSQGLKEYEKYYNKRLQLDLKYEREKKKIDDDLNAGLIFQEEADTRKAQLDKQKGQESAKLDLEDFKASPLYAQAMADGLVDSETIKRVQDRMYGLMTTAAKQLDPSDFKAFADTYQKISEQLIENDPFGSISNSLEDLDLARGDLERAKKDLQDFKNEWNIDESGNPIRTLADGSKGKLYELEEAVKNEMDTVAQWQAKVEDASLTEEQRIDARTHLANAQSYLNFIEARYNKVLEEMRTKQGAVINSETRLNNAKKKLYKSFQKANGLVQELGGAFADLAGNVSQASAELITGTLSLIDQTVKGIGVVRKSGEAGAKGLEKVGRAVTKAVAILAIIQAAWQVINTIMSLFSGGEEERYKQKVDGLKAKISTLDYSFNKLKEDMDDTWGTEAIDNYIKAVDTLNEKQQASLELIKTQAAAHIKHHSLNYYIDKNAGITSKEKDQAKAFIQQLGGNVSGDNILDWLYSMSPEQLREFMASGIGTTIMGKIGGVSGTGDYSGSDWLSDMQAYADSAKTVEELADSMAEKLNGISLDGLKDEFKDLVTTFETSLNDINNSFDEFMREGIYSQMRTDWDNTMQDYYDKLSDLNKRKTNGEISDAEYKKELARLREEYQNSVKKAQNEYQEALTDAGVNVKNVEQSSTSGGFEAMSEDTGTELNGRFAAMQAQETITAENTTELLVLTGGIYDIADEIRTVQVNSYLELQAINENTRKVVEPILEMQENIKKIKDNTDNL